MDSLQIWWEGPDGSKWDLVSPHSPTFAVSIDGLGEPNFTHQWSQSGARDGMRHEGVTWEANMVTLTVQVGDSYPMPGRKTPRTGQEWRDLDREFRRAFSAEQKGRLVVEGRERRHLEMQVDGRILIPGSSNPAVRGSAIYVIPLVAGDVPWWQGEEIVKTFGWSEGGQPFFGGNDGSVLLFISPNQDLQTSAISNPGDRPVKPKWWAVGPGSHTIGVGDQTFKLPFTLAPGERVDIDSDAETIIDDVGNSLWPQMGFADPTFPDIPQGESISLVTGIESGDVGSQVGISIVPLYEGPW